MEKKFNIDKLNTDQQELLVLLMEECGEVIHAAAKCIRDKDYKPTQTDEGAYDNLEWLKEEMIGLKVIIGEVSDRVTKTSLSDKLKIRERKWKKLSKWTDVFNKNEIV